MKTKTLTSFPADKALVIGCLLFLLAAGAAQGQTGPRLAFRAVHYDIFASLAPAEQTLTARAKVDFQVREPASVVIVELHPNLRVTSVLGPDNRSLVFERDESDPMLVRVNLAQAPTAGQTLSLTFEYSGPLANEQNNPVKGVRLASINPDGAYLLLPARWFPLTGYPWNRYTATYNIEVPESFTVAGTGKASPPVVGVPPAPLRTPTPAPGKGQAPPVAAAPPAAPSGPRTVYTFRDDQWEDSGTIVAGKLQMTPVQAEGLRISVFTRPEMSNLAAAQGEVLSRILNDFSSEFGTIPDPNITLAMLPDGGLQSFTAPGLILVAQRLWEAHVNYRPLAQAAARLWWGEQVMPVSTGDVWITDGLARYSEGLYVEQIAGKEGFNRALEDFAVGALMYEEAAPIAQAVRLQPGTSEYRSVVLNKGAMVFHMLRGQLGDDIFKALLRDFYAQYKAKDASIEDFKNLAMEKAKAKSDAAPNLQAFFAQWLNSTGIPEFHVTYVVYRVKKGFQVIGKVKQDLDTFRMTVEMKIETEGNPEYKTVDVVGTDSDFTVETFGRPKAGGITLDPNNNVLKASNKLRVRAAIARGEEMAEVGRYYDAIQQYQKALGVQKNNSLAHFRIAEALFYEKNWQAAANAFREAIDGDLELSYKWVEVWSHIYLGKIFDLSGQRERAVNEYSKAKQTNDDTGGAQGEVDKYIASPYKEEAPARPGNL